MELSKTFLTNWLLPKYYKFHVKVLDRNIAFLTWELVFLLVTTKKKKIDLKQFQVNPVMKKAIEIVSRNCSQLKIATEFRHQNISFPQVKYVSRYIRHFAPNSFVYV